MNEETQKLLESLEQKKTGPRGGDLEAHLNKSNPAWRQCDLNTESLPSGGMSLHRFEKPDTATTATKNEQVWHRMAALMLIAGRTNSEIAVAAGVVPQTVSILRAQRWFQQLLATMANEAGADVLGALKSYALEAVEEIHSIARNADSERVSLSAWQMLLEHATGKPIQKTVSEISHSINRSPSEEMQELQTELAALRSRTST